MGVIAYLFPSLLLLFCCYTKTLSNFQHFDLNGRLLLFPRQNSENEVSHQSLILKYFRFKPTNLSCALTITPNIIIKLASNCIDMPRNDSHLNSLIRCTLQVFYKFSLLCICVFYQYINSLKYFFTAQVRIFLFLKTILTINKLTIR